MPYRPLPILERFENKAFPEPMSGCWIWVGQLYVKDGYGKFVDGGKDYRAHRVAWRLYRGEIPAGLYICHKCDNKICVNPDHLYPGTQHDNMRDASARFRLPLGDDCVNSVLTSDEVREIRRSTKTQTSLANIYNVDQGTISKIVNRHTWRTLA